MRKVYESPAFEKVGHFQSILESVGIATLIKNEVLILGAFSVAGDYPELWVMDDGEYERAVEILRPYYEGKGYPGLGGRCFPTGLGWGGPWMELPKPRSGSATWGVVPLQ